MRFRESGVRCRDSLVDPRIAAETSMPCLLRTCVIVLTTILLAGPGSPSTQGEEPGWSEQQIDRLSEKERQSVQRLFDGESLEGWKGRTEYWSVRNGVIVGKNGEENAPKVSTYLLTEKSYREFRLIFEGKLVESEMHTGVALWGTPVEKEGDPYSYMGHLVMFPTGYGFWDLYRRNSIYRDEDGVARQAGRQHDWNRMEILATGHRIRFAINGKLVADWSDPQPELVQKGPIGLQLHSNKVPQEVHFRGLILTTDPEDRMVTVDE